MNKKLVFKKRYPYNHSTILDIPECSGVYIFFNKSRVPIYVGLAKDQPIKRRIKRYLKFHENHNPLLASYIRSSKFSIFFSYLCIQNKNDIRQIESYLIKKFQPIANYIIDKNRKLISNRFLNHKVVF